MTIESSSRVRRLHDAGVSVWLDTLSRPLLEDGVLAGYIREHGLSGVTSNPSIFAAALHGSDRYTAQVSELVASGTSDATELFFALALRDVSGAADLLSETYRASGGRDGFVSFECTPDVADDTAATIRQAEQVWRRVDAPNLMIKVPGTPAGMAAIEELTFRGINVNVTLLFSERRYREAARAFLRGLQRRAADGGAIDHVRSVGSLFVSRVDARVDRELPEDSPLRGSVGIAGARAAYLSARRLFSGPEWDALRARGAHWQRPLWASTAPKDPAYPALVYVEGLALPDTIATVPEPTLAAFAARGRPRLAELHEPTLTALLQDIRAAGIDLDAIGDELLAAGLQAFSASYADVLDAIRMLAPQPAASGR